MWLVLVWMAAGGGAALAADAAAATEVANVAADAPSDLSVTIYRSADRVSGSIDLDQLSGFALISEARSVNLPAGESRLRFEGVADGIEPASALVTGLPSGVIEKNRTGAYLSPSALVAATVGKPVVLLRTNPKTGRLERRSGRILADAQGGIVFETAEGIEGLRCSGLKESFSFAAATDLDLAAHATLSVLIREAQPATRMVTLTYLARGFDWAADYTANLSADETRMELGAWVTLANGNGIGFPGARAQMVAGRVNRERSEVEPIDIGGPILASCWPRGSTSDIPALLQVGRASFLGRMQAREVAAQFMPAAAPIAVTAERVEQEQLGDLKLYRVPDRTTISSRQSKQVRLLDRSAIPVTTVYSADVAVGETSTPASVSATRLLRTTNDSAHHLGLPLPSGRVAVFSSHEGNALLERETGMRDLAVGEEVEIDMGTSSDVLVRVMPERADTERVAISNARAREIQFELRLRLPEGTRIVYADRPFGSKNGRPIFRVAIPAHAATTVRYRTK
jgi:hypothetical protein